MHLVDTTLFYSPTSGGVKRYLSAKHAWLSAHTSWEHSIVVPGPRTEVNRGAVSTLAALTIPGTFNYRLPLNPRAWNRMLDALEPDLIEAGDAFHPAWSAWIVARRRGMPVAAFYHSNFPQLVGRRIGSLSEHVVGRYVRWLYEQLRPRVRAQPLDVRIPQKPGGAPRGASAARRGCRHLQARAPLA